MDSLDRVEQTLKAMSFQTKVHLAWRFRQWYQHRQLLAAIAAPPLREMITQMAHTAQLPSTDDTSKRPFSLYSCHDITILGLLYGVGADFLADETVPGWDFWPSYASALVFELVRTNEGTNNNNNNSNDSMSSDFVVRILLMDGKKTPQFVHCVNFATLAPRGTGVEGMMRLNDLEQLVQEYEDSGGQCAKLDPTDAC